MQFEELQQQWHRLDEKLERTMRTSGELLRLTVTQPARRRMNRSAFWPALDTAFCAAVLLVAGSFIGTHWNTWSLVVPAGVVMMAAIALLSSSVRQLMIVSGIDWSHPVVDIQRALAELRLARIRQFKWIILLSPLVGFCGLIVGLQWLLDRLPEQHFILDKLNPWWVAGNVAFGALFIPFGQAIVAFLARRFGGRGWWQRALADISGASMKKAEEELNRWVSVDDRVLNDAG